MAQCEDVIQVPFPICHLIGWECISVVELISWEVLQRQRRLWSIFGLKGEGSALPLRTIALPQKLGDNNIELLWWPLYPWFTHARPCGHNSYKWMVIGITVGYPLLYTSTAYSSMAHLCSSGLCCFSLIIHRICWFMFQNVPNILSITSGPLAGEAGAGAKN